MESRQIRAVQAENSLASLQTHYQNHEAHKGAGGWLEEEEPEETHWDRGTQTEDEQCLPPNKHPIQIEEDFP